jgi:hypothetical protein
LQLYLGSKVSKVLAQRLAKTTAAESEKKPLPKRKNRKQTPHLDAVQARAAAMVDAELGSPYHMQLLIDEQNHETHKMEVATRKELEAAALESVKPAVVKPARRKRVRKTKLPPPAEGQEAEVEGKKTEVEGKKPEEITKITTLLLLVTTAAGAKEDEPGEAYKKKKEPKKTQHALMLWEDGPSMHSVSSLPRWVVEEYKSANMRGIDGACSACTFPADHDTLQHFEDHKLWHASFREFWRLRSGVVGGFTLHNPGVKQVKSMLGVLTKLWQQVSPSAPWFLNEAFSSSASDDIAATVAAPSSLVLPAGTVAAFTPVTGTALPKSPLPKSVGMRRVRVGNYA